MTRIVPNDSIKATFLALRNAGMPTQRLAQTHGIPRHTVDGILYRHEGIREDTYRRLVRKLAIQ